MKPPDPESRRPRRHPTLVAAVRAGRVRRAPAEHVYLDTLASVLATAGYAAEAARVQSLAEQQRQAAAAGAIWSDEGDPR